jgi:hypothetical protein
VGSRSSRRSAYLISIAAALGVGSVWRPRVGGSVGAPAHPVVSSAIAYAGLGRTDEAAADLDRYLAWLARQRSTPAPHADSRAEWRRALGEGRNPLDPATLARLARE